MKKKIIIGRQTGENKPKRKFRILIQERLSEGCEVENMKSFMVYDYTGKATIDSVTNKLHKGMKQ